MKVKGLVMMDAAMDMSSIELLTVGSQERTGKNWYFTNWYNLHKILRGTAIILWLGQTLHLYYFLSSSYFCKLVGMQS